MPSAHQLRLHVIGGRYSLARLDPTDEIPAWAHGGGFVSISRSRDELSIICATERVPAELRRVDGYVGIAVAGPLAPELVGVLASMAGPLADAGIPIVAVGTFDTDYVFVREADLARGIDVLRGAGHSVG